jgi:phage head maturation protease
MSFVMQGIACDFGKCFSQGDDVLYLKSGCFGSSSEADVRLLIDHGGKSFATTADRLDVYLGDDALTFRYMVPDSWSKHFAEPSDDFDTYAPVSVGFSFDRYETITIDGIKVKIISDATLNEISILSQEPAIKSTYSRIVSMDTCGSSLKDDYERMKLRAGPGNLHRTISGISA